MKKSWIYRPIETRNWHNSLTAINIFLMKHFLDIFPNRIIILLFVGDVKYLTRIKTIFLK